MTHLRFGCVAEGQAQLGCDAGKGRKPSMPSPPPFRTPIDTPCPWIHRPHRTCTVTHMRCAAVPALYAWPFVKQTPAAWHLSPLLLLDGIHSLLYLPAWLLVKTHARICEATGSTLQCLCKHDPIRSECHGMDDTQSDDITCAQARGGPHAGGKTLTMLHTVLHITCKLSPHTTRILGHYELTVCTDNSTAPMPHPLH